MRQDRPARRMPVDLACIRRDGAIRPVLAARGWAVRYLETMPMMPDTIM